MEEQRRESYIWGNLFRFEEPRKAGPHLGPIRKVLHGVILGLTQEDLKGCKDLRRNKLGHHQLSVGYRRSKQLEGKKHNHQGGYRGGRLGKFSGEPNCVPAQDRTTHIRTLVLLFPLLDPSALALEVCKAREGKKSKSTQWGKKKWTPKVTKGHDL